MVERAGDALLPERTKSGGELIQGMRGIYKENSLSLFIEQLLNGYEYGK